MNMKNTLQEKEEYKKIAIIDADSIIFRASWNKFLKAYDTNFNKVCESADRLITEMLFNTESDSYIGFFGRGHSFRKEIVPSYKENRSKLIKPPFFNELKEYISHRWCFNIIEKIEADDAVNITKIHYKDNGIICAIDKDILSLEGYHYNYGKREFVNTTKEEAELAFFTDMITGQSGDNVKGIPGLGPAFAKKFFKDFSGDYVAEILMLYITYLGEYEGVKQFYNNYIQLKILNKHEGFSIPDPIKINTGLLIL